MDADIGRALNALGDPTRRAILSRLAVGPVPVGEISRRLPVGRPAVSMHLRVLRDAGLVMARSAGNRRYYQLNPDVLGQLRDYLDWYWTQALAAYKAAAEQEGDRAPMSEHEPEISVVKTLTVQTGIARAFEVFADHGQWWPVQTHHMAEPPGTTVILEPFVGGRWYERSEDGSECDWGRVLAWEPPHRMLLTWQMGSGWVYEPDPGLASEIEVRFTAEGPSRTRVEFTHWHLERYAGQAERMRSVLDGPNGASGVLVAYGAAVSEAATDDAATDEAATKEEHGVH
jgi:DNA-binding transcriptional ArsR family regulator/uncharacterized protein YndB with AHSA1/START domain